MEKILQDVGSMKIGNSRNLVLIHRKVLEDKRLDHGAVGFYCRLLAFPDIDRETNEEEEGYVQHLYNCDYLEKSAIEGIYNLVDPLSEV